MDNPGVIKRRHEEYINDQLHEQGIIEPHSDLPLAVQLGQIEDRDELKRMLEEMEDHPEELKEALEDIREIHLKFHPGLHQKLRQAIYHSDDLGGTPQIISYDNLIEIERLLDGIDDPHEIKAILNNIAHIFHQKGRHGLHHGFRQAMYHMDNMQSLYKSRKSSHN